MEPSLAGYELRRLLRRTSSATVYRALRLADGLEVVAKFIEPIEGAVEAHYRHEFNLLRDLEIPGAVRALELRRAGRRWALILEAFPGVDLGEFAGQAPLALEQFLAIATRVSRILAEVHRRRVIHRDIKPSSILFNPATDEVCLADFGISIALERSHKAIYDPGVLTGTLPYLSPEQSGRTTRAVDHRSDLYSLGATFYELLVGHPPFVAREPMALVHAHLARVPTPVHLRRPEIPAVLARIIDRLLAKDPSDRYQSADGLAADLERCASTRDGQRIPSFELGADDHPTRIELPDRLYGRGRELARLNDAFDRACSRSGEFLLLRGAAGVGKTALIHALQGPLAARSGYFALGKFEQFRSDVPFLGLIQALTGLLERLLIEDEASLARWRERLGERLGPLAPDLCSLLPILARLLELDPSATVVADRSAVEDRNRILVAVSRLLRVIASPARPVVLVLDDLHWSDPGSVRVLEHLLRDREGGAPDMPAGLLLIGAYRDAELQLAHPLTALLGRIAPSKIVELGPLADQAVSDLIADVLRAPADQARAFSRVIAGRTHNNPMLIRQLLGLLEQRGVLSRGPRGWTWTAEAIRSVGISSDALALIEAKLETLDPRQREALAAATCLGNRFDLASLAAGLELDPVELYALLLPMVDEGLLALAGHGFRFTHDRIEEAARRGLEAEVGRERDIHARIGRHRLAATPASELELAADAQAGAALVIGKVYAIVDHLGWTVEIEHDPAQLHTLARLEEIAGRAAIRASAYAKAERYLAIGRRALARAQLDDPALSLALAINHARAVALGGDRTRAAALFDQLAHDLGDPVAAGQVALARVEVSASTGHAEDAIETGLRALAQLGVELDRYPTPEQLDALFGRLRAAYSPTARAELARLPDCDDRAAAVRAELLVRLVLSATVGGGLLGPILMITAGLDVLASGRTPFTAQAIGLTAVALAALGGDHLTATELIEVALAEVRRPGASAAEYVTNTAYNGVLHWTRHYRECRDGIEAAYELAVMAGNLELAVHDLIHRTSYELTLGEPLDRLLARARETVHLAASVGLDDFALASRSAVRTVQILAGVAPASDEQESDADELARIETIGLPSAQALAITLAIRSGVFLGRPERAIELGDRIAASVDQALLAVQFLPQFWFHYGLATAMAHRRADPREPSSWAALRGARDRLAGWSDIYAGNYGHKRRLLEAELARIEGREAEQLYELAAAEAAEAGYAHIEALCWERLARARIELRRPWMLTEAALRRARALYSAWGADHKVALLEREFVSLGDDPSPSSRPRPDTSSRSSSQGASALDLASVLASTQGIARGRDPSDVIQRVLAAAIENAGARRGVLISIAGDAMLVEVERDSEGPTGRIPEPIDLAKAGSIVPVALARLVARTGEPRIIDDAQADPDLASDPLVRASQLRSICCLPITAQNRVVAVLYLDNPLVAGVFRADRLAILEHLAAQAAITLESARLMDALRDGEARWRSLVDHAPVGIALIDRRGRIEFINRLGAGSRVAQVVGSPITDLFAPESVAIVREAIAEVFRTGTKLAFEAELQIDEDQRRPCDVQLGPIWRGREGWRGGEGHSEVHRVTLISTDTSERRALESQLRHAQKLEAIGTLAGGVAHDFNNLLSVMIGSADLAIAGLIEAEPALREILEAAERAGALTRQLLAFGRKQVLQPRVLELDAHVEQMIRLLRRLLGEQVELRTELGAAGRRVRVDPSQLEQVILNLVVNARDAMPRGGEIVLRTAVEADQLLLSVADSGEGIDPPTLERIFEPFFTTKPIGQGTGLGLSTVHGIVSQSGGRIDVESTVGRGTSFFIRLPLADAVIEDVAPSVTATPRGSETILLVEDEQAVRDITSTVLTRQGYRVLAAADAVEALALIEREADIQLLITDVVLPGGVNGRELADRLRERVPGLEVLYMSGYTDDPQLRDGLDDRSAAFLQKPFTRTTLINQVRALLDR